MAPRRLECPSGQGAMVVSEVRAYGDVVLRFVSREGGFEGPYLPGYRCTPAPARPLDYGLRRLDHAVGNVWDLLEAVEYIGRMTGFHEFAEFTAEDVGTLDSGLNSIVLANNDERVLIPVNEPTFGTRRKSQIQTYLEYNKGPGLQHLALATDDIFATVRSMREASVLGGFDFQEPPPPQYYRDLPKRLGDALTPEQYRMVEELGLLADKDDQGVLLQVFTRPVGDRPTLFLEIIQRIGCEEEDPDTGRPRQRGGCGGFGKGNFRALFESIERYEESLKLNQA
jgi:4-hydroxyphenylpyruvate dioxygenase